MTTSEGPKIYAWGKKRGEGGGGKRREQSDA